MSKAQRENRKKKAREKIEARQRTKSGMVKICAGKNCENTRTKNSDYCGSCLLKRAQRGCQEDFCNNPVKKGTAYCEDHQDLELERLRLLREKALSEVKNAGRSNWW